MTLLHRRLLLIFFILFFIVVSPLLILYALGYKYDAQKGRLEKTGVFFIKAYPKNAEVYLNSKNQNVQTPTRLTRLLPNTYQVTISKEGFLPWIKNLNIEDQTTTFIEDVSLFKENLEWGKIKDGNFNQLIAAPNKTLSVILETNTTNSIIWLYNLDNNDLKTLYTTTAKNKLEIITWSETSQKILIKKDNDYLIINIDEKNNARSIYSLFGKRYTDLRWNDLNDNILYATRQNQLYELDLISKKETLLIKDVYSFEPYLNKVIYVEKQANNFFLSSLENTKTTQLFKLPSSNNYLLKNTTSNYLVLMDEEQDYLYLLDPNDSAQPVNAIIKNVVDFNWLDQQIIYWNNSELWVYYPESKQKILVERTSEKITQGFFHPNAVYVYGVIGNKLKVYELDGRDSRNNYELLNLSSEFNSQLITDKKGQHLFLLDFYDNQKGLFKIQIQ